MTLLVRKRYRGTSELILDINSEGDELGEDDTDEDEDDEEDKSLDADDKRESQGLDDEGQGLDDEGQGLEDEGPGVEEGDEATPEGLQQAFLVVDTAVSEPLGLGYGAVPSPIALPVATLAATISVDEDRFLAVGAQLELHENHNLRRQLAEERRERLELTDRVARMERRQESGEE
nr:hypothetical protein [Tanacetum cinerariifolium]